MDRFVYQNGLNSFMTAAAPRAQQQCCYYPMTTAMIASRFETMSKPKVEKKSHSEAESRRRKRINDHLITLRTILPSKVKTDKATLLMETVQHVKELKRKYEEIGVKMKTHLPNETDTVSVSACENESILEHDDDDDNNSMVVKATVCCEDRPELHRDLNQLLQSVQAKITRTEMMNVGGRTKVVMKLRLGVGKSEIGRLKRGLLAVAENRLSGHLIGMGSRGRFVGGPVAGVGGSNFSLR